VIRTAAELVAISLFISTLLAWAALIEVLR
jgi:hypothetical protein